MKGELAARASLQWPSPVESLPSLLLLESQMRRGLNSGSWYLLALRTNQHLVCFFLPYIFLNKLFSTLHLPLPLLCWLGSPTGSTGWPGTPNPQSCCLGLLYSAMTRVCLKTQLNSTLLPCHCFWAKLSVFPILERSELLVWLALIS